MHKGLALRMVNRRLLRDGTDTSDASIAAVALLTGGEVCTQPYPTRQEAYWLTEQLLFGTPEGFNTHMRGLKSLLKLRGTLEPFRHSNPSLFAMISWCVHFSPSTSYIPRISLSHVNRFDYSGSCNFLSRRRFNFGTPSSELLYSSPSGIPENILKGLPAGYDLYRTLADTFKGLLTLTTVLRRGVTDLAQRSESSKFITQTDSDLYRSILLPDQKGVRSRRRHIQQSLEILALTYAELVSMHFQDNGAQTDTFIARFKAVAISENVEWGLTVVNFFRYLLLADDFERDDFSAQISSLYDVCAALDWSTWRNVKKSLFDFFLYDSACQGRLQTLWQRRICTVAV